MSELDTLRRAAVDCRACPLWRNATQTVFGQGPTRALVMLVGDQEDLAALVDDLRVVAARL